MAKNKSAAMLIKRSVQIGLAAVRRRAAVVKSLFREDVVAIALHAEVGMLLTTAH